MKWKRKYRQLQSNRQSDYTGKHIFFLVEEANGARTKPYPNPIDDRVVTWQAMTTQPAQSPYQCHAMP